MAAVVCLLHATDSPDLTRLLGVDSFKVSPADVVGGISKLDFRRLACSDWRILGGYIAALPARFRLASSTALQ